MHIRFWGTRGSLSKAGPATLRYGGNTSCVEVGMADGTLIVFDRRPKLPSVHERTSITETHTSTGKKITLVRA